MTDDKVTIKWCPECNQGWVRNARIIANQDEILVCDECETTWFSKEEIGRDKAVFFETYLKSLGLKGRWDEIEVLDSLD